MSSTVQDTNLFNGISGIFGQIGDGLSPGFSLEVAGNDSIVSITVFNPDRVDLQVEFTRQNENQWLPLGEITSDSRIFYTVWHEGYLYRVRQLAASTQGVSVRVQNNQDRTISDEINSGFLSLLSLASPGAPVTHTHTLSDITNLNDAGDLPSGIDVGAPAPLIPGASSQQQMIALAAAIDPYDHSSKTLLLGGQNAPAQDTIPPEVIALTGDDAEPSDTPKAIYDDFTVYYEYNAAGVPVEIGRIARSSGASGPHTHAISEITGLEAQLLAITASIDPNDQSTKTLLLGGQNAPAVNTVPPEIAALAGDDAEPDDTPKAVYDDYIVYYEFDAGSNITETGRIKRSTEEPTSLNVREIIAGDGTGATTASGVTLTPLPGENYWPVDLSDLPELSLIHI